jgi:hypothetical protein
MKREVMLGKLVFAEELLAGVSGESEPMREALQHVIAVVRAMVEQLVETPADAASSTWQ